MLWATVPETSIHKHDYALFRKSEVRVPVRWKMPAPASDRSVAEDLDEFDLGVSVACGPDGSHNGRSFPFAENVRHGSIILRQPLLVPEVPHRCEDGLHLGK